jgi:hypothetical protein
MTQEQTIKGLTINYDPNELTSNGLIRESEEERLDRALGLMEVRNPSLGNLVEEKEEETFFGNYESRTVVKKIGTDFMTNQPVYSIKLHEITHSNPLREIRGLEDLTQIQNFNYCGQGK